MHAWVGICMLLAAGFGVCLGRLDFVTKKNGKLIAACWLLAIGAIVVSSRYKLEPDDADYQRTAVIDSWSGERVATIHRKHQEPSE
jgi:hypothetical protein